MKVRSLALFCLFGCVSAANAQIHFGQADTFDTDLGTWGGATVPGTPPERRLGGPGGATDGYMHITAATTNQQGSRVSSDNDVDWIGNYNAAGVTALSIDFKNFSNVTLDMRVVVFSGNSRWTALTPFILAPNQNWTTAVFQLDAAHMKQVQDTVSLATTLSNVDRLMFRHDINGSAGGSPIDAQAGYDNIRALPVPEPATLAVLAFGGIFAARRRRK